MLFDVNRIVPGKRFSVGGASYIGAPKSNTAMYITKKVEHLLGALVSVSECLIFAESNIEVPAEIAEKNAIVLTSNPQLAYARFATQFADERFAEERKLEFSQTDEGYFIGGDCEIGENAYIEPGCVIGPDVQIGKNAVILAGIVIRRATIGDNFYANEHAVVGANGYTMAVDETNNKLRIPTLGRVIIGDNVEIGAHDNVSCGSSGDTVIEDNVKIDALVHIGHDVHLHRNVGITAGGIIGGFDELGDHSYVGINAVLRNRITVGDRAVIGMGSTVTKSVDADVTIAGNPAKLLAKKQ